MKKVHLRADPAHCLPECTVLTTGRRRRLTDPVYTRRQLWLFEWTKLDIRVHNIRVKYNSVYIILFYKLFLKEFLRNAELAVRPCERRTQMSIIYIHIHNDCFVMAKIYV